MKTINHITIRRWSVAFICSISLIGCVSKGISQSVYSSKIDKIITLLDSTNLSKNYSGSLLIADGGKILLGKSNQFRKEQLKTEN